MRRREFITLIGGTAAAWPIAARAQQPARLGQGAILRAEVATGFAVQENDYGGLSSISSAGVFDSTGKLVRTLWSAVRNHPNVADPEAAWDGTLDHDNTIAPTGAYTIKVLTNAVTYTWEGVVGNTSPNHLNNIAYHNEAGAVRDMEIAADGQIYYTTSYSERLPVMNATTTANPQEMDYPIPSNWVGARNSHSTIGACCTDGINIYWGRRPSGQSTKFYILATVCATHAMVTFANGTSRDGYSTIGYYEGASYDGEFGGLAVQKRGHVLFASRPALGQVWTMDKTTGETLQTNAGLASPGAIAISPITDRLWLAVSTGALARTKVIECDVAADHTLVSTGVEASGLQDALEIAISPDGATLLVADGGTSQQVKAFNTSNGSVKTAWASNGELGSVGGYTVSPAVTKTKFLFENTMGFGGGAALAYAPDGSFWLGDCGNCRCLHFSGGNVPTYVEEMAWIPSFYPCSVCFNDDTRVFTAYLEWKIDYGKDLAPGNGSWELANNWWCTKPALDSYSGLKFVGTFSNGRTYASCSASDRRRYWHELTATGLRDTGVEAGAVWIDKDFHQYLIDGVGPSSGVLCHYSKNTFTGFDGSNNPIWAHTKDQFETLHNAGDASVNIWSVTLPPYFPPLALDYNMVPFVPGVTVNGVQPIYCNDSMAYGANLDNETCDHFGGIHRATGTVKYTAHPVARPLNHGINSNWNLAYPPAPYFSTARGHSEVGHYGGGPILFRDGTTDVFTIYRGENWAANQTNVISHWHESGLLVGRWGPPMPYWGLDEYRMPNIDFTGAWHIDYPRSYYEYKGLAGAAGNAGSGGLAYVNSKYYIYQNDEWYHSGCHRWRVDNLASIQINESTVVWDENDYVAPTLDPNDLLAELPFDVVNLPDGTGGWYRSPANDVTTNIFGGSWWRVATNVVTVDPRLSPDLMFESHYRGQDTALYRSIPRVGTGNWMLDMTVLHGNGDAIDSTGRIDVLDASNKIIVRCRNVWIPGGTRTLYVNDSQITPPKDTDAWNSYVNRLQPLQIIGDVSAGKVTVNFAEFTMTDVSVYEAGADVTAPARFEISCPGAVGGWGLIIVTKLKYSET